MDTTKEVNPNAEASALAPATGSSAVNVGAAERVASALGGIALAVAGLRDPKSPGGIAMLLGSGFLLSRGASGFCFVNRAIGRNSARRPGSPVDVRTSVTLNRPVNEVYAFWRKLGNLPRIMRHLAEVEEIDQTRSRWTARGPGGIGSVSWEAEIVEDKQNEFISWRSLPGSTIDNAGEVRFIETPQGTDVRAQITYRLPAGDLGGAAAKFFSPMTEKMIRNDIRDLKQKMESGEAVSHA